MSQILGINHIGLAPKDPAQARWFFEVALGLAVLGEELVKEQETMTVMIRSAQSAGFPEPRLEIVAPEGGVASGKGPIAKFLEKKGSGIHHVALNVTGLEEILAKLKSLSVRLIDATPRSGAHKTRIAFVHPESTGGLLVELVEETT